MATPEMYREEILERYKKPRNRGTLERADGEAHESNPLCGDEITIRLKIGKKGEKQEDADRITDAKFEGAACAICTAACDMLIDEMKGKTVGEVKGIANEITLKLLGIDPGPARIKCALLPVKALKMAVYKYLGKNEAL